MMINNLPAPHRMNTSGDVSCSAPFRTNPVLVRRSDSSVCSVRRDQHFLTYLSRVSSPGHVLGANSFFDAVHFLLVSFTVSHGRLLGVPQGAFQSFHPLCCGPQTLLQLRQLTAKVCIVPNQLENTKGQIY